MKFLGWMHHKFRENSKEPLKDITTGNSCFLLSAHSSLDSQDVYPTSCAGPRYNTGFTKQLSMFQESSFAGPKENTEENFKDETNSEFFHGFLAIGTLGIEPLLDEPATPTFGISSENPTKDNADVTEDDLKRISNELEKFLEAEAKEGHNQPSGRNSDTNTIASTINAVEGLDAEEDNQPMKFPLQEYLFGSPIELQETKNAGKKERASLEELFKIAEMQDNHSENIYGKKEKQSCSTQKSPKDIVKKVLKKLHLSSRSSATGKTEAASIKKKFPKILQLLHRKVHPENPMLENGIYSSMTNSRNSEATSLSLMSETPTGETSKRWIHYELGSSCSARNREHWIKTDEDYFVLEL